MSLQEFLLVFPIYTIGSRSLLRKTSRLRAIPKYQCGDCIFLVVFSDSDLAARFVQTSMTPESAADHRPLDIANKTSFLALLIKAEEHGYNSVAIDPRGTVGGDGFGSITPIGLVIETLRQSGAAGA